MCSTPSPGFGWVQVLTQSQSELHSFRNRENPSELLRSYYVQLLPKTGFNSRWWASSQKTLTTKPKTGRRQNLLLAVSKKNTGVFSKIVSSWTAMLSVYTYSWRGLGGRQSPGFSWLKSWEKVRKGQHHHPLGLVVLVVEPCRLIFPLKQNWESLQSIYCLHCCSFSCLTNSFLFL